MCQQAILCLTKFVETKEKNEKHVENCGIDLLLKPRCQPSKLSALVCAYLGEHLDGPLVQARDNLKPSESDWITMYFYHQNQGIINITFKNNYLIISYYSYYINHSPLYVCMNRNMYMAPLVISQPSPVKKTFSSRKA